MRQVFLRAINHALQLIAGHTLDWFIPNWARPTRDNLRGTEAMLNATVEPVHSWRMLKFVSDEEGLQTRAMHFLFSYAGLRGALCPEISHPKWNCFKRACQSSGMQYDLLRLTIAANYSHGTKITGDRVGSRKAYLQSFLRKQSPQYFLDLRDEILLDRGMGTEMDMDFDAQLLLEEFMTCPSIVRKGPFDASLNCFANVDYCNSTWCFFFRLRIRKCSHTTFTQKKTSHLTTKVFHCTI